MSDRPSFDLKDLKKLQATKSSPETVVKLCYCQKEVYIKPMKVKDKKEVLKAIESKNETVINKALDTIIEKYVESVNEDEEFNVMDLTSPERHQLLVHIRVAAAGQTANIAHECPKCKALNRNIEYNLTDMYIQNYKEPETGNKIELTRPGGKIEITLGPISRLDEVRVESYIKKNSIKTESEKNFALMAGVIRKVVMTQDDITGEVPMNIEEKIEFFESLDSNVFELITEYFKDIDFGVKMPFQFKCDSCEFEKEQEVNVAVFFIS